MSLSVLLGAVEQGCIYALVTLGLYLSYTTLNIADLTTDGSFVLGAACSAILTTLGHPFLGLFAALLAGGAAGGITAVLQTKLGVAPILAGIITMTGLYSVNIMVMGNKSNLPMLKSENIFTYAEKLLGKNTGTFVATVAIAVLVVCALVWFLRTQMGLSLRATGDNRAMVSASSINPAFTTTVGLCIANALVSLSGGLIAQYQKFSDVALGTGMVVIGLASLVIGQVLGGRGSTLRGVIGAVVGTVIYRIIIAFALTRNINANNLKLLSAVIVAAAISFPAVKEKVLFAKRRKENERHA